VEKHLLWRQGVLGRFTHRRPTGFTLDPETEAEVDRLFGQIAVAAGQPERVFGEHSVAG